MENGLPVLNCLLQHTLRSLCSCSDSSKWAYAVFWRILPRNYPPPKWDHGGGLLDRAKGNKRNWILVWEDGFCDFRECERAGSKCVETRFGADIFFKMTHEVYNFGEGLVGKVASDNSHKWVYRDIPTENDPVSTWNVSIDPQPRAWEVQFSSGIETIAIISVREGAIQLGSFDKVVEDPNMVLSIQRKFSCIQSRLGVYQPIQDPSLFDYNNAQRIMQASGFDHSKDRMVGLKRQSYDQTDQNSPAKSVYLGYNSPHNVNLESLPLWSVPPLLAPMPNNLGAYLTKMPPVQVPCHNPEGIDCGDILLNDKLKGGPSRNLKGDEWDATFDEMSTVDGKVAISGAQDEEVQEEKHNQAAVRDGVVGLGFEHHGGAKKCC